MATALAAMINLATGTVQVQQPWWAPLVWALTVLLIVGAIIVEWRERRSQAGQAHELNQVTDWLARQVREQWEHEAVLRRLAEPMPLQVRWRSTRRPVVADRHLVLDGPAEADWESLPLHGQAEEITQAFLGLPHERLVVLGEPGAGKSVLAVLLTLGLLRHRQALPPGEQERVPVPVLVPIASWNPQVEHLQAFLARRLSEDYPRLRQLGEGAASLAAALIADRRLLAILDGLDELPEHQHQRAVSQLNGYAGLGRGLVVTCRSREYEQAVGKAGMELARAAVVELQPVTVEQAIEFLSQPARARPRWQPVFDHLRAHPDGALAVVLSTPLMTTLARAAYADPAANPGELVTLNRVSAIRATLIDGFVAGAYQLDRWEPLHGRRLRGYPPERAGRWLACLAFQLTEAGRVDWWWWQMPAGLLMVRPYHAAAMIVVGAILLGAGLAMAAGLSVAAAATVLVAVNVADLWRPLWPTGYPPSYRSASRRRVRLLRMVFAATGPMMAGLLLSVPLFGLAVGLITAGLVAALPIRWSRHSVSGAQPGRAWSGSRRTPTTRRRAGPRATVRANHRAAAGAAIRHAVPAALIVTLAATIHPLAPDVRAAALVTMLVSGANAGLASGWRTWIRYRTIHLSLAARGLLPWRLWRFLEDAHLRGVLRQVGGAWQFRHVLLQTHLATAIGADHLRARAHAGDEDADARLIDLLAEQGRTEELRARADAGDGRAAGWLAGLLAGQGRMDEAIALLRPHADGGSHPAAERLVALLAGQGRMDEALAVLAARADAGDYFVADQLVDLLAEHGRVDELRARADAGDGWAAVRLAGLLAEQGRTDEAIAVLTARADAGDVHAVVRLARLAGHGRLDEAIAFLRPHADAGHYFAGEGLASLLAEHGRVHELRARADAGDLCAALHLAGLLAGQGRVDEAIALLRPHADAGALDAEIRLASLLAERGRVDELRSRADAGDGWAAVRLADVLAGQGRTDEAIALLIRPADAGDYFVADRLVDLLAEQGRVDELRARADAGEFRAGQLRAAERLADLLAEQGRVDELRARADAEDRWAAGRLAGLLAGQGRVDEAIALLRPHADAGDWEAVEQLVSLLCGQGRADEAIALLIAQAGIDGLRAAKRLTELLTEQGLVDE
ncbi:NACHT domain-containing protein [Nonomuraea polychroma]|uniref:NACHT domain-containing protein n=1 Tax=Nonomuraea polychroma TaxID=46176 RepID=A0A438MH34_9ACTN|nr:NACHT domain-containing protein [Nonomuraea polychroma]RVX45162.1 NACHT domain-containing protein [Nonomuraea polychroma]